MTVSENAELSPPPRRRAARLTPERRERAVLEAAVRVFGRLGVSRARHKDVARDAGVSESTVFVYFPTRRALREAVFDHLEDWAIALAERTLNSDLPADRAIEAHFQGAARLFEDSPEEARIWIGWSMAVEDELWPRYRELQQRILKYIADTVRRGQREGLFDPALNPDHAALGLLGSGYMVGQAHLESRDDDLIQGFGNTMVARLRARLPDEPA